MAEHLLSIEQERSIEELLSKELSKSERSRIKELNKELKALSKEIQEPLLQRSRYGQRNRAIGLIFMNHGMYVEAREYLTKSIEYDAKNPALFYYRALCSGVLMQNNLQPQKRKEYLDQARWDYQRSLEIKETYTNSLYGLAALELFEEKNYQVAAELLDRYIAKRGIRNMKGQAKEQTGRLRDVQQYNLNSGKTTGNKDVDALFMRAQASYGLERYSETIAFYDLISKISSSSEIVQRADQLKEQVLQNSNF